MTFVTKNMLVHLTGKWAETEEGSRIGDFIVATPSIVRIRDEECLTKESVVSGEEGYLYSDHTRIRKDWAYRVLFL
jgi:hypothetical protein